MKIGTSPRVKTSRKRITYKPSSWRIHQFEIWSGERVCKAAALRVEGALLLWLGGGGSSLELNDVALSMPPPEGGPRDAALATTLLGEEGAPLALARRLSTVLAHPVYVCSGIVFDRFTIPLVERGLIAEIKSRPECF